VNRYLHNLFGHVVGKICWQTLQTGQSGPCDFCTNEKLIAADGSPTGVYAWEFHNSITSKWYEIHDRAISWVDGRIVRLEIAVDITDRKQVENELRRAHHEMGTFCRIIKEIGVQQTLDGIGSFLMKELNNILDKHDMLIFFFSDDRDIIFKLTEKKTKVIKDPSVVHTTATKLADLNGITISPKEIFKSPLVPDDFSFKGRQTIIPFQLQSQTDGALVIACEPDCKCQEKELDLVALILEQSSGAIKRAALHEQEIRILQSRIKSTAEYSGIIGKDPKMQVIYKLVDDIAPTDATVLIEGESGTGKELVARAIHHRSLRKNQPFVVINCSAYPVTLLESELFGHEKGAFTGAIRQKSGRFEQAHGGTVFLDEIGEIAPSAQIKLLRVLQSQSFERLGGEKTLSVDVRILAATNKDLLKEVKNGNFREDLFYRLKVIPIHLPPLRERRNDIPLLTRHFERKFASEQGEKIQDFSSEVMRCLLDYAWPGNVRELENSIEHAVVLSKGSRIEVSHLPSGLCQVQSQAQVISERTILENEKRLLSEVLEECDWNKSQAAMRLGISRSTLYDKIKKYQVSKSRTN
jgi:two-component system response regulator HydG